MEVFDVFENGDLQIVTDGDVLSDIIKPGGQSSKHCYVILNHDWKICYIWIGKEANTRRKFASARSSRTIINDRRLSYRIKTIDEDSEPDVFKEIMKDPVRKLIRDEGPTLEIIEIQKRVKNTPVPDGYEREGLLIGKKYYVAVITKVMQSEILKFEKSTFLPEGLTDLPENYVARMFVKHGNVIALEFLSKKTVESKEN
ncbi:MAG: hypothetical protein ACTSVY_16295 [Candidatus Helarchaeota archaeon]